MTKLADELEALHIVFDGPPSHEAGRFVECETPDGRSLNAGEWHERNDGLWELRISASSFAALRQPDAVPGALVERLLADQDAISGGGTGQTHTRKVLINPDGPKAATAIQTLTAERNAALARVAELEVGLQPFSAVAGTIERLAPITTLEVDGAVVKNEDDPFGELLVAVRSARALLEGPKP